MSDLVSKARNLAGLLREAAQVIEDLCKALDEVEFTPSRVKEEEIIIEGINARVRSLLIHVKLAPYSDQRGFYVTLASLQGLAKYSRRELLMMNQVGPRTVELAEIWLHEYGLKFLGE